MKIINFFKIVVKKILLLFLILSTTGITNLLTITPVHADSFYPSGNVGGCHVATVVGVQYNSIGGNGVNWNSSDIDGVNGNWIQSHHFTQVADITYPDAHRYPYIADRVAVPPNTRVEIGSWTYSYADHGVNIDAIHLFTSRSNPADGDLTRLGAGGSYGTVNMNGFPDRSGKYITTGSLGYFPDRVSSYGQVIYSFETIQPIQLQSFTATPIWNGANLTVRYTAVIRNVSAYNLCNIRFRDVMPSGAVYDQTHCINSGQNLTITYDENWGTNYPNTIVNDPATIWDNNWHEETQSGTQPSVMTFDDPTIRPGVVMRDDLGAPSNWNAGQPVWGQIERPPIIVALVPYWFNSGQVQLEVPPVLSVTKTVTDEDETNVETNNSRPNDDITYNITVRNTGGHANNVVVVDDYDQSLLAIINSGGGADNGNTITWNIPVLQHDETRTFQIQARTTSPLAHGSYNAPNLVTVDSDETTPINDSTRTTITAEVRMEIDKTVSDSDEAPSGSNHIQGGNPTNTERQATYRIRISNTGDADAHNTVIHDDVTPIIRNGRILTISDNGILTTQMNGNGQLTGQIVWNIGDLPQTETREVQFTVQFNAGIEDNTQIQNIAEVRTSEVPPVSDTTLTTIHSPILEITKDDGVENADPSDTIHWAITVRNTGTGNAYNVEVYDIVPERMTVSDISDDGAWDGNTRRVAWSTTEPQYILNGSYQPDSRSTWGSNKTLTFNAKLDAIFPIGTTNLTNIAITETSFYPPDQAEHNLPVEAYPNNDIEKYVINETSVANNRSFSGNNVDSTEFGADADSVFENEKDVHALAGDTLRYTLVYRNTGNAHSPDTYISDHLPKYITDSNGNRFQIVLLNDIHDASEGFVITETEDGFDIVWDIGELQVGNEWNTKSFRIKLNSDSTTTLSSEDTQRLINNISEIGSENELVRIDTDNATVRVNQPNATIEKTSDKIEYQSDEEVIYTITISNIGNAKASGIVSDSLPEGLSFKSTNYASVKTQVNGRDLSFSVDLDPNQSIEISITASIDIPVTDLEVFNNKAVYKYEDDNSNNRPDVDDDIDITVHAPILELVKEQTLPEYIAPAQPIVYTINFRNVGTGYSPNTILTDNLPEHVTFVEFLPSDNGFTGVYDEANNSVSWDLGKLESNQSGSVSFRVVIDIPTPDGTEIKNTAIITNPVSDEVESEVITATASSCCMGGFIWEDENSNAIYDEEEKGISNVRINISWEATEYLPEHNVDIFTSENGHYEYNGLPYFTVLTVRVFKPQGYDNITTPSEFKLVLLPPTDDGVIEDYVKDGVRYLTASGCSNFFNAGIYRDVIIAQTGLSVLIPLSIGITLIGSGIALINLIHKSKKKKQ